KLNKKGGEREVLDVEILKKDLLLLSKFLDKVVILCEEEVRIRDLPACLLDKEDFKNKIRTQRLGIREMRLVKKRFQKNIKKISELRKKIIQIPLQEIRNGKVDKLLLSELVTASQVEKDAKVIKELIDLIIKEEKYKEKIAEVRRKIKEI
ncbi:hypothetical protein J7K44_00425, partial [bacterium]|nr:hypothetical protein [bacterium]